MMRITIIALSLLLGSCGTVPTEPDKVKGWQMEPLTPSEVRDKADNLNWALMYLYAYVKTFNEYAVLQGWKSPNIPPLCRLGKVPEMPTLPTFVPTYRRDDPQAFEKELVNYVKEIRRNYRDTSQMLLDFELSQQSTCLY